MTERVVKDLRAEAQEANSVVPRKTAQIIFLKSSPTSVSTVSNLRKSCDLSFVDDKHSLTEVFHVYARELAGDMQLTEIMAGYVKGTF